MSVTTGYSQTLQGSYADSQTMVISTIVNGQDFDHHKNQQVTLVNGVIAVIDYRGYVSEFQLDRRHTEIFITTDDIRRQSLTHIFAPRTPN
ncbi:hypothetical protein ABLB69_19810 [Xenorhabdus khoisanae]|uniref:Uncharacterized protein n=1 Tax=Xenorhabdus khoisanae TaxID=880157 RepID=A0A0J5FR61_9GAMM|nr:hypothetical protein [Xenorhabdus khoisanae]KMJ44791.1 hypothetical protein AB204_12440 [Xenorhabdus khoisanae]